MRRDQIARFTAGLLFGLAMVARPLAAQDSTGVDIPALVAEDRLAGARWPDFTRYADDVALMYSWWGDSPIWTGGSGLSRPAREALAALNAASDEGLDPGDYDALTLDSAARSLAPATRTWFDLLLTVNLMRYLDDLRVGRTHPGPLSRTMAQVPFSLPAALTRAIAGDSVQRLVAAVSPPFTQYHSLRLALATYRRLAVDSPAVPLLRARVRQLELALERLRWLPPLGRKPFVVVNIPGFELFAFDSTGGLGAPSVRMKVIVGKAFDTQTPVLVEQMRSIEFFPYWHVPHRVLVKEILPEMRKDSAYLRKEDMELATLAGAAAGDSVTPAVLRKLRRGELRVRQRPSKRNPLDGVIFRFPNAENIYLHGTPNTELFSRSRRDFSHGCIRLEHPETLAAWVLRDQPDWTPERIAEMMAGPTTTRVPLAEPLPVILFYTTAVVEPDGRVEFYEDIYGHDARLAEKMVDGR